MSKTRRILRGILAALALTVVLLGVPIFLTLAVGWPLPRAVPAWSQVTATLSGANPLDNAVVWKLLAVVIWIAWAQILLGTLLELNSARGGHLVPALRGFGFGQGAAGYLIGAISLALPAATTAGAASVPQPSDAHLLTAPIAFHVPEPISAVTTPYATPGSQTGVIDHVVQRRENLWVIARRYLPPDASHADIAAAVRRIFDANVGRAQPDGATLTDGSTLRPGWTLRIEVPDPSQFIATPAPRQVTVAPGDTLSELAQAQLGDAGAYHQLFEANKGRPQPDGGALSDENLIRPGWVLDLPTLQTPPPGETVSAPAAGVSAAPAPTATLPTAPTTSPTGDEGGGGAAQFDAGDGSPPADTPIPATPPAPPQEHGKSIPIGLIGAGLSTAGVVALLDRRRRAQQRHRRSGRHIPVPTPTLQRAERNLRAGAATGQAVLLETALRAATSGAAMPPLRWIESSPDHVILQLAHPAPAPAGFTALTPDRWQSTAPVEELAGSGGSDVVATPTLVPIGTTPDGVEILVDLEAAPVTSINGDAEQVAGLLRSMTLALATASWSEDAIVTLVGLDVEGTSLTSVHQASSLAEALDAAESRAEESVDALASVRHTSAVAARAAGVIPDAWAPLVVVSTEAPTEAERARLAALVRYSHRTVAVICPDAEDVAGATITLSPAGLVTLVDCPLTIAARHLDPTDERVVFDLLEIAAAIEDIDEPDLLEPIDVGLTTTTDAVATVHAGTSGRSTLASLLDELDILVRVMGEVEAVRLRPDGEDHLTPDKQKGLEAVAYLASRDAAVPLEDVQAALWPAGANSAKTFRNAITSARSALGPDRDGDALLPNPEGGRYDLSNRVATDYELFHELTHQADQLGDDQVEAVAVLLTDALGLIRGEPYLGAGRNYAWVAQHRGIIVAEVVNAAEELAEITLDLGDWRAAEWAARQGLRAFPCDERLYRILMRAADAAGTVSGVRRVFHELCEMVADPAQGCEPEDTVHPETLALLEELTATSSPGRATA